ncbi:MAG: host attachment protein [Glycocaulis sp.]
MFLKRKGELWLVVADGRRARIFSQTDRASPLTLVEQFEHSGEAEIRDKPYRVQDSHGRRHALADAGDLKAERQARFLASVADTINAGAAGDRFEHLIVAAPAKALGVLRKALDTGASERVRADFSTDLAGKPEHELNAWLASVEPQGRDVQ